MKTLKACVLLGLCLSLTGCGAAQSNSSPAVDVGQAGMQSGWGTHDNGSERFRLSHALKALAAGSTVTIYTGQPWQGRQVTLYLVPPDNLIRDTSGYYLKSLQNVRIIGVAPIQADGLWTYTWPVGHERNVPKRDVFLLAKSDVGEYAMAQVQHFQQHRY